MAISIHNLSKTYGEGVTAVDALKDVDLEVPRGQFTVILGPSGSGKTTLLNMVGGIDEPTSGSIEVEGTDLGSLDDSGRVSFRRTQVGFVFQFFNLIPTLTAAENVELVAGLAGEDARGRADRAMESVGLGERRDHFPSQLSGGEQQRVAIARALAKEPPVLLCDEPTGDLDFETGRMILGLLRRLNRENGQTVLLVTHNAAIGEMADRVVRKRSGKIVEDRSIDEPVDAEALTW
jgi:putative ABC transport system ATP-binding protein